MGIPFEEARAATDVPMIETIAARRATAGRVAVAGQGNGAVAIAAEAAEAAGAGPQVPLRRTP